MGYRSDVKFLMKEKDYNELVEFSKTSKAPEALERLLTIDCECDDKSTDRFIPDGWKILTFRGIKWYKKFPEIDFMNPKNLKDNYGINVDFVRLGEKYDDIEYIENIYSYEKPIGLYVERTVDYCKNLWFPDPEV